MCFQKCSCELGFAGCVFNGLLLSGGQLGYEACNIELSKYPQTKFFKVRIRIALQANKEIKN